MFYTNLFHFVMPKKRNKSTLLTNDLNRKTHKLIVRLCIVFVLAINVGIYFTYTLNWYTLSLTLISLLIAFTISFFSRKLADISIKEEMILIHRNNKPCQITELKTLKKLKNWMLFNTNISKISYKLDGKIFEAWTLWRKENLPDTEEASQFADRMQIQ